MGGQQVCNHATSVIGADWSACGGLAWTARRELCHAAFSRWLQWYLDTPAVEASFAWADFVEDDI